MALPKNLLIAALLSSVAAVAFAQTPASSKLATARRNHAGRGCFAGQRRGP